MAIIVNADDFGKNHEVNMAICEAFEKGLIGRTTLMTNMPYAEEAMEMAREGKFADKVGIHLNLTTGKPLSSAVAKDANLCDENGQFNAFFAQGLKTRFFLPKKTLEAVKEELRLQLDRYRLLGGTLWHVDSHHHVHTDPSIWKALKRVIPDYPITSIRLGRNMYRGGNPLMHLYKLIFNSSVKRYCKSRCDYFGSAEDYDEWIKKCNESEFVLGNNIEIMVHPMYSEDGVLTDSENMLKKYMHD